MQLKDRLCNEYVEGVRTFIQATKQHLRVDDKTRCPCRQCLNVRFQDLVTVEQHLIRYGFSSNYNRWIHHGENVEGVSLAQTSTCNDRDVCAVKDNYVDDDIIAALNDMHAPINKEVDLNEATSNEMGKNGENMDYLFGKAYQELYPGCTKFLAMTFLVKLMHIKVLNGWSNKSFDSCLNYYLMLFQMGQKFQNHIMMQRRCYGILV